MIVGGTYKLKATASRPYLIAPGQEFVCIMADVGLPFGRFEWFAGYGQRHTRKIMWRDVDLVSPKEGTE